MSMLDDLVAAIRDVPPDIQVVTATVVTQSPLTILFAGETVTAQRTSAFDLVASVQDVTGKTVLVALPSGQPVVTDVIMGA